MIGTLGDFGTERPVVEESFGYFGASIRVNPNISDLGLIEMFRSLGEADEKDGVNQPRQIAEAIVHEDDVAMFLRHAVDNRQTLHDLIDLGLKITEALTGRPTRLPSASSDGQSTTATNSVVGSSSPALRLLEGRPDLQVAVMRAEASALA